MMKKLMIALAIVALASVAQAELLATWTASGVNNIAGNSYVQTGGSNYTFTMVAGGGWVAGGTPSAATYAGGGADAADAAAAYADGQYLYFTWDTDYTLSLDSIDARYTRSGTGAQNAQWGTIISSTWSSIGTAITSITTVTPTTSTAPITTTFSGVTGLESGQLGVAFYGGTSSANTAWVRLDSRPSTTPQVALSINGT
ncbi:MAG TPA: hypothetical protein PLT12_10385, partial [Kiritimatiellia bacterium]|nr:hypothetical protein [Kiritimatiellia bacterium]